MTDDQRPCTCPPDDRPPVCQHDYALTACWERHARTTERLDFHHAHLVPEPYTARAEYRLLDNRTYLRIDRRMAHGEHVGIDIIWNLTDKDGEADAKAVIDQMVSAVRRELLTKLSWEGRPIDTPEQQGEAILGLHDEVVKARIAMGHYLDDLRDAYAMNGRLRNALRDMTSTAWVFGIATGVAVLALFLL